jgi:hypothetical protein
VATAEARGWGPPCKGNIYTLVRADGLRLPVRAELADLTAMLCDLSELAGYDLVPGWCWGYACRMISGTDVWSNHAWGLADDLNAPANPYASAEWHHRNARGTFPFGLQLVCDIPEAVLALWEAHGYRLGARYVTKPDPMHVEFMGTPTDAAAITKRLRDYLTDHGGPPPAPPEEPVDYDRIQKMIDDSLNARGLTRGTDAKKGGAIGELRRNLRRDMQADGIPDTEIEK